MIENIEPIIEPIENKEETNTIQTKPKKNIKIIAVLLILVFGYIIIDNYNAAKDEEAETRYKEGFDEGIRQAISYLVSQAVTCEPVPITLQDTTISLIAVECLGSG